MTLHPPLPVVTHSFLLRAITPQLSTCPPIVQWHCHLCISALASPAFFNISGRLTLNMDPSIYRSGILVMPFTVVSSALPTLVTSPRLFRLSPVIQRHICVWTLFSLWVCSYHPHFSVQLQRRQRIYPMSTWLIIAFRHQSMVLPWEPPPPPRPPRF